MKKITLITIIAICSVFTIISWLIAVNADTTAQKQLKLIRSADALVSDGIYMPAVPLLEEAASYNARYTPDAEEWLKYVYLQLMQNRGYKRKYTSLLDKQMSRADAPAEVFIEAARYYLNTNATREALTTLKRGIAKTSDESLVSLYESARYSYEMCRATFDSVKPIFNQTIQVRQDGKWGVAKLDGTLLIPCQYDKVSTLYQDRIIVKNSEQIYAVDKNNNKISVTPDGTLDFRNCNDSRTALLTPDGWVRASIDLTAGTNFFEDIGTYSDGYVAAMVSGKWGVVDKNTEWLISPEYDEVICDELGRCYGQDAVFVRNNDTVMLFSGGSMLESKYQDARPFSASGYAAVKKNGKWGFIDTQGNVMIDFLFDDALSFDGHLAAVSLGTHWGYISLSGDIVIDTVFLEAKSFSGGSAPVLTDKGWQIITLFEYKKEEKLL